MLQEPAFLAPMEIRACGRGPLLDVGPAGLDRLSRGKLATPELDPSPGGTL